MKKITLIMGLIVVLSMTFAFTQETTRWVNVHVEDAGDDTKVDVKVPLSLLAVALNCVKTEHIQDGKLKIDFNEFQDDMNVEVDFKAIWEELRKYEDTEFVTVQTKKENVRVARKGDMMIIKVLDKSADAEPSEAKTNATIRIPISLVDAVLSAESGVLDLKALVSEFESLPSGDLVEVFDNGTHVRIWID